MQREIIVFDTDHPLPPDVQRIITTMFDMVSKTTVTVGTDVRRLIIGADIFGFLWRMLLDPCRREAIINSIYSDSLDNFMVYIARWHAAEFNIAVQTLPFKQRYSTFSYPEITDDWRACSRWMGWARRIPAGQLKGVFFACRQYFISKKITGIIHTECLCKFMHAVLRSETLTRRVLLVKNLEDFYDFMAHDPKTHDHLRKMGIRHFDDLECTALEEEIETLMNLLKAVK